MGSKLKDQKVIIMGGTSGVGLATAQLLVESGADVVITGRDQAKLDRALEQLGAGAVGVQLDATSTNELKIFYENQESFDHLVIAVSGARGAGAFREIALDDLREGFEAKFWPQVAVAQLSLDSINEKGSITFISAISSRSPAIGTSGLAAINAALEAMVPSLALELTPMRVNAVSPGVIETPWWNWIPEEQRVATFESYAQASTVNRVGQPEDIAKAIQYLIDNTFVTGTVLEVDGGLRLK